jgi:steroid delta-isomerase-like uncharacterized protein
MNITDIAESYIDGWNRHSPGDVITLFGDDGLYFDPNVPDGISGQSLVEYIGGLIAAFPDLHFKKKRIIPSDDQCLVAEWVMCGTNTGSLHGLPPSGKSIALPGIDVIDTRDGKIRSLRGYFNNGTMLEQLDLRIDVQPKSLGPFAFGTSTYVSNGSIAKPGVFGVTQIVIDPDVDEARLRELTREILMEVSQMPGFISSTTSLTSKGQGITLTAWEDMESAKSAVAGPAHKKAIQAFFEKGGLSKGAWTSILSDGQLNTLWRRCGECGEMAAITSSQQCKCGASLPDSTWF